MTGARARKGVHIPSLRYGTTIRHGTCVPQRKHKAVASIGRRSAGWWMGGGMGMAAGEASAGASISRVVGATAARAVGGADEQAVVRQSAAGLESRVCYAPLATKLVRKDARHVRVCGERVYIPKQRYRVCVCYAPLATKLVRKDARRVDGHQSSPEGGGRFARTVTKALWR